MQDYEQLELDTRSELAKKIAALTASAEMDRVLQALYRFENSDDPTPIEALAEDDFEEAADE